MSGTKSAAVGHPPDAWPPLPLKEWEDTRATLHMWTQIVGKIRLAMSPKMNHWWEVALYVDSRGLTTSPMPYAAGTFEMQFDFIDHKLVIHTSDGAVKDFRLGPRTVADFYSETIATLRAMGINVKIWPMPMEIPDPIRFDRDHIHASYDPVYAHRFWRILVSVDTVFKEFRSRFIGKCSPVHFFWGAMDLAVSRFSGRRAPERPGADRITQEGYSHEDISAGFWPGSGEISGPCFYAYAAPEPEGFSKAAIRPSAAFYSPTMKEFFLMYDDVRQTDSPENTLLDFLQTTYDAGATLGNWDRTALERAPLGT